MNSGTRGLKDRSTSGSISSTNHLFPLLRTRVSEGLSGTLWRSLTSFTSASCNRTRISANSKLLWQVLNHSAHFVHVKISCHQVHTRRFVWSQRNHSPSTVHAPSCCHHTDSSRTTTRPYVQPGRTPTLAPLPCWGAQWISCRRGGNSGHPRPSHRDGHPCTVDVLPEPTGVIWSPG